jgi:hypothetical protein
MCCQHYTDLIRPVLAGCFKHVGGYGVVGHANIDDLEVQAEYQGESLGFVHVFPSLLVCLVCHSRTSSRISADQDNLQWYNMFCNSDLFYTHFARDQLS